MIALDRAMQEKHHQMTFFLKLQETDLEVMFRWDSIRSIRSRPNDNEVKSAYWPSAAVNPHQPSLRAFKVRSTNASLRSAARMLMQRQALLSQVDGGMAMWPCRKEMHKSFHPKILTRKPWVWCRTNDYNYRRDIADQFDKWYVLTHWQYMICSIWAVSSLRGSKSARLPQ